MRFIDRSHCALAKTTHDLVLHGHALGELCRLREERSRCFDGPVRVKLQWEFQRASSRGNLGGRRGGFEDSAWERGTRVALCSLGQGTHELVSEPILRLDDGIPSGGTGGEVVLAEQPTEAVPTSPM